MRAHDPNPPREGGHLAGGLLGLLAVDLFVIQIHVFSTLKLLCVERGLPGTPNSLLSVLRDTPRVDILGPLAALGLILVGLVIAEVRSRAVSSFLLDTLDRRWGAVIATLVVVIVGARYYFDLGYPGQYDAKNHFGRVGAITELLRSGEMPDFTFSLHVGHALLRVSGGLVFCTAAFLTLLLGSAAWGFKLTLFGAHVGGAMATYHLVRVLGGSRRAAFLGAVGSGICFQHTSGLVLAGRIPVAFLYVFFPLALVEAVRLSRGFSLSAGLRFGLWSALMVVSHPGLAVYGILAAAMFAFVLGCRRRPIAVSLRDVFLGLVPAGAVCVLLSASLVVPALLERESLHIASMYSATGFEVDPTPDVSQLSHLVRWNFLWSGTSVAYLGISLLLLCAFMLFRRGGDRALRWALGVAIVFLLVLTGGSYLQSRSVHFLAMLVAVGAGLAIDRVGARWFAPLVLLVILDLGPTTFQSPYRPDIGYDVAYAHRVAERADGGRVLRVSLRNDRYATSEWSAVHDSGLNVPAGPFREASNREIYPWMMELIKRVQTDLNARGELSEASLLGLRCLGCEWIICEDGTEPVIPKIATTGLAVDESLPGLRVVSSSSVVAVLDESDLAAFDGIAKPSWADALAAAPARLADPGAAGVEVLGARRTPKRITLDLAIERDGILLLAQSRMPGLIVRVDGEETDIEDGPFGLIGVRVGSGRHEVDVAYRAPGYVLASRWVSMTTLVAVLAGLLLLFLRRRRARV
jgi:hypothetical protein